MELQKAYKSLGITGQERPEQIERNYNIRREFFFPPILELLHEQDMGRIAGYFQHEAESDNPYIYAPAKAPNPVQDNSAVIAFRRYAEVCQARWQIQAGKEPTTAQKKRSYAYARDVRRFGKSTATLRKLLSELSVLTTVFLGIGLLILIIGAMAFLEQFDTVSTLVYACWGIAGLFWLGGIIASPLDTLLLIPRWTGIGFLEGLGHGFIISKLIMIVICTVGAAIGAACAIFVYPTAIYMARCERAAKKEDLRKQCTEQTEQRIAQTHEDIRRFYSSFMNTRYQAIREAYAFYKKLHPNYVNDILQEGRQAVFQQRPEFLELLKQEEYELNLLQSIHSDLQSKHDRTFQTLYWAYDYEDPSDEYSDLFESHREEEQSWSKDIDAQKKILAMVNDRINLEAMALMYLRRQQNKSQ